MQKYKKACISPKKLHCGCLSKKTIGHQEKVGTLRLQTTVELWDVNLQL